LQIIDFREALINDIYKLPGLPVEKKQLSDSELVSDKVEDVT